jgi:hypothetical protein
MSQGNDFANYSAAATGSTGSEDVWFVAVASDDIKQMSVDQLDEAFRLGIITADTAVWTEGMEAWAPLGQVADLESSSEHGGGEDNVEDSGTNSIAPAARSRDDAASLARGVASFGNVTMQSAQHGFSPGPSSISPVTASYAPSPNLGLSTGPVALNVDEDMPSIRHGRRFRPERWALAAAALVAIGVVGYNNIVSSSVASAGTQSATPTALAARPYEGADGVEPGEKLNAKAAATEGSAVSKPPTPSIAADEPAAPAAAVVPSAKVAAVTASDEAEPPASSRSKASSDKEGLKGSFSKAFNKKEKTSASRASKERSRKAASRATTKPRATKSKKPSVVRAQSAFDPLNDSLP